MAAPASGPIGVTRPVFERFSIDERLCVNYTLHCNIECGHCNVSSSPRRRERLSLDCVIAAIRRGAEQGKRLLTLSGGEVFLYYDDLLAITAEAAALGYEIDVETNAYFARTYEAAERRLRPLREAGLTGMCLSCDVYHVRFFPLDRPINAARAGQALGLLVEVNFCPSDDPAGDEAIRTSLHEAGIAFLDNPLLNRGRARSSAALQRARTPDALSACDSLNTTIQATGDVFACCELEAEAGDMKRSLVYLGRVGDGNGLGAHEQRERLVQAFYDPDSPAFFKKMLGHEAFAELRGRRYLSICDFCMHALTEPARIAAVQVALGRQDG